MSTLIAVVCVSREGFRTWVNHEVYSTSGEYNRSQGILTFGEGDTIFRGVYLDQDPERVRGLRFSAIITSPEVHVKRGYDGNLASRYHQLMDNLVMQVH